MNKLFLTATGSIVLALLGAGCGASNPPASSGERPGVVVPTSGAAQVENARPPAARDDTVLAEIAGVKLTESQLKPVLYKAYGLDVLLKVIQLNMAKADAAKMGITVSPADVENERTITFQSAFGDAAPEDYPELLRQMLAQQHVSQAEFDVVMEVNAYLRAMVKGVADSNITEEMVRNEFDSLYGERVVVRDIALNNMQEVAIAQRMLNDPANPRSFEEVAKLVSRLPSEPISFARTSAGYNPVFVAAAFALEPGTISTDPIQDKNYYHILKVERRIKPTAVKYEDVKESVREELIRRRAGALMGARRTEMAQRALRELRILEPSMKAEFDARLAAANPKPAEKAKLIKELDAIEKEKTPPASQPATQPDAAAAAEQPPASAPAEPATVPSSQP